MLSSRALSLARAPVRCLSPHPLLSVTRKNRTRSASASCSTSAGAGGASPATPSSIVLNGKVTINFHKPATFYFSTSGSTEKADRGDEMAKSAGEDEPQAEDDVTEDGVTEEDCVVDTYEGQDKGKHVTSNGTNEKGEGKSEGKAKYWPFDGDQWVRKAKAPLPAQWSSSHSSLHRTHVRSVVMCFLASPDRSKGACGRRTSAVLRRPLLR